jgi:hypothetical protein
MGAVVDDKGLRVAREFRKAIARREEDLQLREALAAYDGAVTEEERQDAAAGLLIAATQADTSYSKSANLALLRCLAPELLPEDER